MSVHWEDRDPEREQRREDCIQIASILVAALVIVFVCWLMR